MTTTARTYEAVHSVRATRILGDTLRRTTRRVTCADGTVLPAGTTYHPLAAGYDNTAGRRYSDLSVVCLREEE